MWMKLNLQMKKIIIIIRKHIEQFIIYFLIKQDHTKKIDFCDLKEYIVIHTTR